MLLIDLLPILFFWLVIIAVIIVLVVVVKKLRLEAKEKALFLQRDINSPSNELKEQVRLLEKRVDELERKQK